MTPDQIDIALSELETRIDRLRALYEQYFMGIERMEPHVPRKDVERRFNDLRKIPFRNTAKRFKFQTLVQRYSTMQQYWMRICREIENGTYKRHKLRAERTIGALAEDRSAPDVSAAEAERETSHTATRRLEEDLGALLDSDVDPIEEFERAFTAAVRVEPKVAPAPVATPAPAAPATTTAPTATAPRTGLLGRLGAREDASGEAAERSAPRAASSPENPLPGLLKSLDVRRSTAPVPPAVPPAALPPAAAPAPTATSTAPRPPGPPPRPLPPAAPGSSMPAAPPRPPPPRPTTAPRPPAPAAAPPTPPPRPAPPAAPPAAAARPPAPAANAGIADERLRALHKSYLEARAQTNASAVSYEKLANNIREQEKKLREQHRGRNVDFDVVVKDGKAIIKPRLG